MARVLSGYQFTRLFIAQFNHKQKKALKMIRAYIGALAKKLYLFYKLINHKTKRLQKKLERWENNSSLLRLRVFFLRKDRVHLPTLYSSSDYSQLILSAHDLQAPLRTIHNLCQLIHKEHQNYLTPQSQVILQLIQEKTEYMSSFVHRVLKEYPFMLSTAFVARIDSQELLKEVIQMLDIPLGFSLKISPDLPNFTSYGTALYQVFLNLIHNAIRHHHQKEKGVVSIEGKIADAYAVFYITDNGPGISKQDQLKLFQPNIAAPAQLNSNENHETHGLGLTLVKRIIESHGGTITVKSKLKRGSTFIFTWPVILNNNIQPNCTNKYGII